MSFISWLEFGGCKLSKKIKIVLKTLEHFDTPRRFHIANIMFDQYCRSYLCGGHAVALSHKININKIFNNPIMSKYIMKDNLKLIDKYLDLKKHISYINNFDGHIWNNYEYNIYVMNNCNDHLHIIRSNKEYFDFDDKKFKAFGKLFRHN